MRVTVGFLLFICMLTSCTPPSKKHENSMDLNPLIGTWKMVSSVLIEKGDTINTEYAKNLSFIKIINESHFAFLQHDLRKGKDSTAMYSSGGGSYRLVGNSYTEHLEYCSARNWEGNDFKFTITIKGDTLVQKGIEIVESAGINRENTEQYVRIK